MLYITEKEVRSMLNMEITIEALEEAFIARSKGAIGNIPRSRLPINRGSYNLMAGSWKDKGVVGHKSYVAGANGVSFHVMLYSMNGEGLIALIEADLMGQIRTGAASGIATKYLSNPNSSTVGIIGSGYQAETQLEAVASVREISSVRVFSRSSEKREKFSNKMSAKHQLQVEPVSSAYEAVDGAEIVITITNSPTPVLTGDMLQKGMHINAAGGNSWMRRELDTASVSKCSLIATDDIDQAKIECGELIRAAETGHFYWDSVVRLDHVVSGIITGRKDIEDVTLFQSQGVAFEDVAVCLKLYNLALEKGIGTKI